MSRNEILSAKNIRRLLLGPSAALGLFGVTASGWAAVNDYPTVARADYVFACMASNGQTRQALERCSCSIDVIASILNYDNYVQAETIMRLRQVDGEKSTIFRTGQQMKETFADLKRAQAEAEIRCF